MIISRQEFHQRHGQIAYEIKSEAEEESVQILKHYKHPSIIFIANGFHRIFLANKLKWKTIKCSVKYVDYRLNKIISLGELKVLLNMLNKLFAKDKEVKIGKNKMDVRTLSGLKDFLTHVIKKNLTLLIQ